VSMTENFKESVTARFDFVYENLNSETAVLRSGEGMTEMLDFFDEADRVSYASTQFMRINGIALVLAVLRMLKYLDFQKRMGVVTRTVSAASGHLFHFVLLFGIVVMSYTVFGFVTFGTTIEGFSTMTKAWETNIYLLMGDLAVVPELLSHPNFYSAYLYYYSYIVIVFMILLNVFLAIIIDAYVEVKPDAFAKSVPEELSQLAKSRIRSWKHYRLSDDKYMNDREMLAVFDLLEEWNKFREDRHKVGNGIFETEGFTTHTQGLADVLKSQLESASHASKIPVFGRAESVAKEVNSMEGSRRKSSKGSQGLRKLSRVGESMAKCAKMDLNDEKIRSISKRIAQNMIHRYGDVEDMALLEENDRTKAKSQNQILPIEEEATVEQTKD